MLGNSVRFGEIFSDGAILEVILLELCSKSSHLGSRVLRYGSHEETKSDNWLDDVLLMSMETTLQAGVESNIVSIPKQQRGSITTLRCIIKLMVMKNQEAKDALKNYIREFDITKFPGENVPTACLCLKAVARALGDDDLPSNTQLMWLSGRPTP
jgi:hypothetical protein